jgi:hypothetical protein
MRLAPAARCDGVRPGSREGERLVLDDDDVRKIVQAVRAALNAEQSVSGTIASRFEGGQLVLRPGKPGTQDKVIPIDRFFRKIIAVRDRLRVLEQQITAHPRLDDADRLRLQEYVTRAYGSLTTFNLLFAEPDDRFVGSRERDEE